jgi:hypothetical protein
MPLSAYANELAMAALLVNDPTKINVDMTEAK